MQQSEMVKDFPSQALIVRN